MRYGYQSEHDLLLQRIGKLEHECGLRLPCSDPDCGPCTGVYSNVQYDPRRRGYHVTTQAYGKQLSTLVPDDGYGSVNRLIMDAFNKHIEIISRSDANATL